MCATNDTNLHASVCDEYRYLLFFCASGLVSGDDGRSSASCACIEILDVPVRLGDRETWRFLLRILVLILSVHTLERMCWKKSRLNYRCILILGGILNFTWH